MKRNLTILAAALIATFTAQPARSEELIAAPASPARVLGARPIAETLGSPSVGAVSSDSVLGEPLNADCCPRWHVTLDAAAVYMQRVRPINAPLEVDTATGGTLVSLSDFHFDWQPGVDARLVADGPNCWGVELRYFWLNESNARVSATGLPPTAGEATAPPSVSGVSIDFDARYRTQFQSAEINLRRSLAAFTVFAGFRYVNLDEDLNVTEIAGGTTFPIRWSTSNNLYGLQLGAEGRLWSSCRFHVDGLLRAGAFYNDASSSFEANGPFAFSSASKEHVAFVGEAALTATYQITPRLALKGGYQFLWLSGVALAGEQVSTTPNFNNAPGLIGSSINLGDAFYHGAKLGVEFRW